MTEGSTPVREKASKIHVRPDPSPTPKPRQSSNEKPPTKKAPPSKSPSVTNLSKTKTSTGNLVNARISTTGTSKANIPSVTNLSKTKTSTGNLVNARISTPGTSKTNIASISHANVNTGKLVVHGSSRELLGKPASAKKSISHETVKSSSAGAVLIKKIQKQKQELAEHETTSIKVKEVHHEEEGKEGDVTFYAKEEIIMPSAADSNMSNEAAFLSTIPNVEIPSPIEVNPRESVLSPQLTSPKALEPETFFFTPPMLTTDIYNKVVPHPEEKHPKQIPHHIHEAFILNEPRVKIEILHDIANRLVDEFEVLRTILSRNDKILDADVQGRIEPTNKLNARISNIICKLTSGKDIITFLDLFTIMKEWCIGKLFDSTFNILYMEGKKNSIDGEKISFIVITGSSALFDQDSISCISKYIIQLYSHYGTTPTPKISPTHFSTFLKSIKGTDKMSSEHHNSTSKALNFWREQCIENVDNKIDPNEKETMLKKLEKLEKESDKLSTQINILKTKKTTQEKSLGVIRSERMELEKQHNSPQTGFFDPVTNEMVYIPSDTRHAVLTIVFGEEEAEAGKSGEEKLQIFLRKHQASPDCIMAINREVHTVEEFCAIAPGRFSYLPNDDKQKILLLAEIVRNRLKEALHDQKSFVFKLERRISKGERELKESLSQLQTAQVKFDINDDLRIKLKNVLNPPDLTNKLAPIALEKHAFVLEEGMYEMYDYVPLDVSKEVVDKLRNFQDYLSSLEGKTELEKNNCFRHEKIKGKTRQTANVMAVCLAAFAVILKHIKGQEKFLIGVKQDYRDETSLGPFSDTMPVKIDLSSKELTLNSLVAGLWSVIQEGRENVVNAPSTYVNEKVGFQEPSIIFEFITEKQYRDMSTFGVNDDDLLQKREAADGEGKFQRLWMIDEREKFDLKLKIIDTGDELKCCFQFKMGKYELTKVSKWVDKFDGALWQIEYGTKKLLINSMISRLYNAVWQGSSQSLHSVGSGSFANFSRRGSSLSLGTSFSLGTSVNLGTNSKDQTKEETK